MKPRTFRLTRRATLSLADISEWTYTHFGEQRADSYIDILISRVEDVAEGRIPFQSCRQVFAPDLRSDLKFIRAGRHFIIFVETSTQIVNLDFLHQCADIGGRLKGPPE